jgi:hypothetical protein
MFKAALTVVLSSSLLFAGHPQDLSLAGNPRTVSPAPSAASVLGDAGLHDMLESMGLAPKNLTKGYLVAIRQDKWTFNVQLVLSANLTKLGFNANCGMVDESAVSGGQWMALLISNGDIEPTCFYYDQERKKLYLHRAIDNRDITPAILRGELDTFVGNLRDTAKLWSFTK